jgi:hypothetical protein
MKDKEQIATGKLSPADRELDDVFGCLKYEIEIVGDIVLPAVPGGLGSFVLIPCVR